MKLTPRDYQLAAHDAVVNHWKKSITPCIVEATTGAGKSIIIALLARTLNQLSNGKRVLCLAPSRELTLQNADKYKAIGEKFSIYSASAGQKNLRHQVVFATPLTFVKVAERLGREFAGVIIDEAHGITNCIKEIIELMQKSSPNLRVCGLSATPYRLGDGFIFGIDPNDKALPKEVAKNPYFYKCVYSISARALLDKSYLTPLRAGDINAKGYDTSGLKVQSNGSYSLATVKAAFEGWGRETSAIIADVVEQTQDATGVMIFASTIEHAKEVMASLHPDNSRLITGETKTVDRVQIIEDFKKQKFLYLVNVSVLTTGFDAPNVSHIAVLRATESVSLMQQIMGRGMRLYDGKKECLILDYAGNIERHFPDGDLYKPQITASYQGAGEQIECRCEECNRINLFSARPNEDDFKIDENGYFLTEAGTRVLTQIEEDIFEPVPAHYGRRCQHENKLGVRCDYYWTSKTCKVCECKNDIAARYCKKCKAELVNPNEKLVTLYKELKKDPTQWQCDEVLSFHYTHGISQAGNDMVTAEILTDRRKIRVYLLESSPWQASKKEFFSQHTNGFKDTPSTITYRKVKDFWEVGGFNNPSDKQILQGKLNGV